MKSHDVGSIRHKIIFVFASISVLIVVFCGMSFYILYEKNLSQAYDKLSTTANQVALVGDRYFKSLDSFTVAQYSEPSMYKIISNNSLLERRELLKKHNEEQVSYSTLYKQAMRDNAGILLSSYLFIDLEHYYYYPFSYRRNDAETQQIYEESMRNPSSSPLIFPPSPGKPFCYVVRNVNNMPTAKASGTIIQCISIVTFDTILKSATEGIEVYLTDNAGVVYAHRDWGLLGKRMDNSGAHIYGTNGVFATVYEGKKVLAKAEPIGWNRLLAVCLIDERIVLQGLWQQMRNYILLAAVFLLLIGAAFLALTQGVSRFLNDILHRINQIFKGNFSVRMPDYKDRDLALVSNAFNGMTAEIQRLIDVVYKSEIFKRDSELKFLQAQMNPHFLFNVLTTIRVKAKMDGNETIYRMLFALGELMRAGIATGSDSLVSLETEIGYITQYLYLQKMRFEDKLSYTIDVPDRSVLKCLIPKLCVESIVENAVIHGIEHKRGAGKIDICITRNGDDVVIVVQDDGVGFDASLLNLESREPKCRDHFNIGLKNTDRRLKLIYGESFGLSIESEPGRGTTVLVRILWKEKMNDV